MSADGRSSVHNLNCDHPDRRGDTSIQLFRQCRLVHGDDAKVDDVQDGSASFLSRAPPSSNSNAAPAPATDYLNKIRLFLDTRRFTANHQVGKGFDFVHSRFGARPDTALGVWRKSRLFFDRNGATLRGEEEVSLVFWL